MSSDNGESGDESRKPDCAAGSDCDTPPRKKAKMWYQQAFSGEWLSDPELKDWIKADSNNRYAVVSLVCTVCSTTYSQCEQNRLIGA
jgi:hypothetical protein